MKTKKIGIAVGAFLLLAFPVFCAMAATKPKSVVIDKLIVDSTSLSGNGGTIAAHKNGTDYTITVTGNTKLTRDYGGRAQFFEIIHNDLLKVWGSTSDGTSITAKKIRDHSIKRTTGLYLATILEQAPQEGGFPPGVQGACLVYAKHREFRVLFSYGYTKISEGKNRRRFTDLQLGDVVSIKGIINDNDMVIYNTTSIKIRSHSDLVNLPHIIVD